MESSHPDRVEVQVAGETVEITWDEREALLDRLRNVHGRETIVAKFQAVETSRTVVLERDDWEPVRSVLQFWEHGPDGLPIGLVGLLSALVRADPGGGVGTPQNVP
jgi:hypothetical protein